MWMHLKKGVEKSFQQLLKLVNLQNLERDFRQCNCILLIAGSG